MEAAEEVLPMAIAVAVGYKEVDADEGSSSDERDDGVAIEVAAEGIDDDIVEARSYPWWYRELDIYNTFRDIYNTPSQRDGWWYSNNVFSLEGEDDDGGIISTLPRLAFVVVFVSSIYIAVEIGAYAMVVLLSLIGLGAAAWLAGNSFDRNPSEELALPVFLT